ncbi:MAG: NAD(P)/FAD-dependent oxidoreductase [Candidatus Geothermincolia bacterium]
MADLRYAIVGNSAAAVNACEAIRSVDARGRIGVFTEENHPAYSRPMISYLVAGKANARKMLYRPSGFYAGLGVELKTKTTVTAIDPAKGTLTTGRCDTVKWRHLLLATGSEPFIPPIEGLEELRYMTFLRWDDAKRLAAMAVAGPKVLIVGAGLIGMKAAEALHWSASDVTVVEKMERVLPQALDDVASRMVAERFRRSGMDLRQGTGVVRIEPAKAGGMKGRATLDDGEELEFDLLIMAVGVRPRAELARDAGIEVNRGILADAHMRTSAPNVYVAGDVAEAPDVVTGDRRVNALWPNAVLQGRYAGLNMAGQDIACPGSTSMNAVEFFGLPVLSAGLVNPPPEGYEVISRRDDDGYYRKVVLAGDVIVGMINAGRVDRAGLLTSLIQERANVRRYKARLLDEGFGHIYFPKAMREDRIREGKAGVDAARR